MTLVDIFNANEGRIIHKYDHYFPIYERHFGRYRYTSCLFYEIGSGRGGSAQMWKKWLGSGSRIVSLDINPDCANYEEDQISVRIGDQGDTDFLARVVDEFGPPDIVLDDGSHEMEHMAKTFGALYPRMKDVGPYMVEDLHCCYMERYGGGLRDPASFIELSKALIDDLNGQHRNEPNGFTRSTLSMHYYPSALVFERGNPGDTRVNRMIGNRE